MAVYWVGLHGPLVLDDRANLEPLIRWMQGKIGWQSVVFDNESGLFGRYVSMATFLANAAATGESVFALKFVNLVLHLLNGVAVYALLEVFLKRGAIASKATLARWLPLLAASIWLLHPLHVSTVMYVVQRMTMLSTLFTLLAMLAYTHGRISLEAGRIRHGWLLIGMAVPACTILGALSKENGILAPALCGVIELIVFAPSQGERRHRASSGFIALVLLVPALLAMALTISGHPRIVAGYENRSFTLVERLLTQPRALWDYVGALLLPYGPRLGLYHDDFPISHSLFEPATTALAIVGWLALLLFAWIKRRTYPALAIGLGIFLVSQALESSVFPLLMYFEHRVYLSSVGVIWAVVGLLGVAVERLERHMHHGRLVFGSAAVALVMALGLATAARASVWSSQEAILIQGLATHPQSRWLRMDLIAFEMAKSPPDVEAAFRNSDALLEMVDPVNRRFGALMAASIECATDSVLGKERLDQIFGGSVATIEADLLVGYESFAERSLGHPCKNAEAGVLAARMRGMLDRSPLPAWDRSVWRLRFKSAKLYWYAGDLDQALAQARAAERASSGNAAIAVMIAGLLLQKGDAEGAARQLDRAEPLVQKADAIGHKMIGEYRAKIEALRKQPSFPAVPMQTGDAS